MSPSRRRAPGLDEPRRWRDSSILESWFLELCLAASSRLVMDVTSWPDAARHGLRLGASVASRNTAVYQWVERISTRLTVTLGSHAGIAGHFRITFIIGKKNTQDWIGWRRLKVVKVRKICVFTIDKPVTRHDGQRP
ncbi:hypothetical protein B0H14DRAFT_2614957 [Mycena olivaceomarginata]|nr:hypothetical protein B0H14DRAFT_2614957 [Mycena olivaceomarginata]